MSLTVIGVSNVIFVGEMVGGNDAVKMDITHINMI